MSVAKIIQTPRLFTPYVMPTAEESSTFCLSTVLSEYNTSGYTPGTSIAGGHAVLQLAEAVRHKPEGRGPDGVIGIFH
jgi:hypothetical protein